MFVFIAIMFACTTACDGDRCDGSMIQEKCENNKTKWCDYHDCSVTGQTCGMVEGVAECVAVNESCDGCSDCDADKDSDESDIRTGEIIIWTNLPDGGWVIYSCPIEEGGAPSPIHQGPSAPHSGDQETPYTLPASIEGVCYYIAFMPEYGHSVPPARTVYLVSDETEDIYGYYTPTP